MMKCRIRTNIVRSWILFVTIEEKYSKDNIEFHVSALLTLWLFNNMLEIFKLDFFKDIISRPQNLPDSIFIINN